MPRLMPNPKQSVCTLTFEPNHVTRRFLGGNAEPVDDCTAIKTYQNLLHEPIRVDFQKYLIIFFLQSRLYQYSRF